MWKQRHCANVRACSLVAAFVDNSEVHSEMTLEARTNSGQLVIGCGALGVE
jgi:hypothetical protein